MSDLFFVDSNVLIYSLDRAEADKQPRAREWLKALWQARAGRLSTQVLCEFYVNVTQKIKPGLSPKKAQAEVDLLWTWQPLALDREVLNSGWRLQEKFDLSFWDSLIVAAAQRSGCLYLLTEDLQAGQQLGEVKVVDPFANSPSDFALAQA